MKATVLYRIASVLLFVAAVGNTYGLLNFWHIAGPMNPVRFPWVTPAFRTRRSFLGLRCSVPCVSCSGPIWPGILARPGPNNAPGHWRFGMAAVRISTRWALCKFYVSLWSGADSLSAVIALCVGWATWQVTGAESKLAAAK